MEARSAVATIDAVAVRAAADSTEVLLHRRAVAPHRGRWALPGVRLEPGERITQAARRAVGKAGVSATSITGAGQLVVFDEPHSDPRGTALSIGAWVTVDPKFSPIRRNAAIWVQWDAVPDLAFDHNRILADVRPILAAKLWTDLEFSAGLTGSEFGVRTALQITRSLAATEVDRSTLNRVLKRVATRSESTEHTGTEGRPGTIWHWPGQPGPDPI